MCDLPLIEAIKCGVAQFVLDNSSVECNLIRQSVDKLNVNGDFSFPIDSLLWQNYACEKQQFPWDKPEWTDELIERSHAWTVRLLSATISGNRCLLALDRKAVFRRTINDVLSRPCYGKIPKCPQATIKLCVDQSIPEDSLCGLRLALIHRTLVRILGRTKFSVVADDSPARYAYCLTTKSNSSEPGMEKIVCGIVSDAQNGNRMSQMKVGAFIKKRSMDLQLTAQHKFGLRISDEEALSKFVAELGQAAVTLDLLEPKHSSSVAVQSIFHSTKATFVLYNSARIETLLRTFQKRVDSGYYSTIARVDEIDVNLLVEEEEWQLIFNYVVTYPSILQRAVDEIEAGRMGLHSLFAFVNSLVRLFSTYYRRVRILMENRADMVPLIHARIVLVHCVRVVLNDVLDIYDIRPLNQM